MSKPRKHRSPEQIVRALEQAEVILGRGGTVADVCRQIGITQATYYRWREKYRGMDVAEAKKLKVLEAENATLKRLLAEAELEKAALKILAEPNF